VGQRLVIRFDCVTIFPEMFAAVTQNGITRRALEEQRWVWQAGILGISPGMPGAGSMIAPSVAGRAW
jgi:hypothetical protein